MALVVVLAGCVGGAPVSLQPSAEFRLDERGISVLSTGQRIDFGRAQIGVAETMTRIRGSAPEALTCTGAGITALAWNDVDLVFVNGAFSGWWTNDTARTTNAQMRQGAACAL